MHAFKSKKKDSLAPEDLAKLWGIGLETAK
jgi:hypothetical protein